MNAAINRWSSGPSSPEVENVRNEGESASAITARINPHSLVAAAKTSAAASRLQTIESASALPYASPVTRCPAVSASIHSGWSKTCTRSMGFHVNPSPRLAFSAVRRV